MAMLTRRTALTGATALAAIPKLGRTQSASVLKIGILNDQSGVYRDVGGPVSVACAKQAISEFASQNGLQVELRVADHQNKTDVGMSVARQWFDEGVDVIMDIQGSGVALAINNLVAERDKVMMACNVGTSELDGKACKPTTIHWAFNTYMLAATEGSALVKHGGNTWYFIRADYAFGKSMQDDTTAVVEKHGGKVLGSVAMPFPSTDFSSAILQAQASGAKVVALANAGLDLINCVKQAVEFGLTRSGVKLATLLMYQNDVHALGLQTAQGSVIATTYYWDLNDRTRDFAKRVWQAAGNAPPNMSQAANYSALLHYMKCAVALGPENVKKSGRTAVGWMKQNPVEDDVFGRAPIRPDGVVAARAYVFEVKSPAESGYPWDYFKLVDQVSPEQAWQPLSESACPLVRS
jgi:branched-chain amino acid transport system substrate-binding protein